MPSRWLMALEVVTYMVTAGLIVVSAAYAIARALLEWWHQK